MRGKIIQYNGADGNGIIIAEGKQFPFAIGAWRAQSVPAPGRTVEIETDGDKVTAIQVVSEDVLIKEKAAELSGKLGSALGNIDLSALKSGGGPVAAGSIVERYGMIVLGAYALFLVGTLVFNAISVSLLGSSMGRSLFEIASLLSQMGANGGGGIKLILVLAYLGVALPLIWRDRRAWLALLLPLVAILWSVVAVMKIMNSVGGGGFASEMADVFSIGFGFYLAGLTALVLAGGGVMRFLRNA